MSMICGIFYYDGRLVMPETAMSMMENLGIYHTDATGTWQEKQVFFGCHAQHITPESLGEIIPYHNNMAGLVITADTIIDNRSDLCDKFGIDYSRRDVIPDSLLILQAYQKWGPNCPKYLMGDFAFSIWDEKRQKLFCAVDHTGTRTFYYYRSAGLFAFSTLIKPLFILPEVTKAYNETWIADFLAMPSVLHQLDPELTLYQNIYLLPAGHTLTVQSDRVSKQIYWQVERQPELNLKSDSEYEEALREVLGEAVHCRLRSIHPVGVMLSGGLDSASVACMAAKELAGRGRTLYAFSAVPKSGYRDWLPPWSLADETPYIEAIREYVGNIDVTYCQSEGRHAFSNTDQLLAMMEQPYKIIENLFWLEDIIMKAQESNIGVVLNGGAGNVTVSWGGFLPYLRSLLRGGQWFQLCRESWAIACRDQHPLRVLVNVIKALLPYDIQKNLNRSVDHKLCRELQDLTPINPDFACRTSVRERFHQFGNDPLIIDQMDSFEARKQHLRPDFFSHLGVITTKQGLAHQIALRDPTMDKRVIEFCLSVPEGQYVRNGVERCLIRRAMTGIIPDMVRDNVKVRGRQSADLAQRLQPYWLELAAEVRNIGVQDDERQYLDIARIRRELTKYNTLNDDAADDASLRMLSRSLIFSRFLRYEDSVSLDKAGKVIL